MSTSDYEMDKMLVEQTAHAMTIKLEKKRLDGRGGWWDEKRCPIEHLRTMLVEHVEKGDMIDVINLAWMIYLRERAAAGIIGPEVPR